MSTANSVVNDGVGPISGSMDWAEPRLMSIQKDRYNPSKIGDRRGEPSDDVDKTIKRLIRESVAAAGSAGFLTGLGGFVTLPVSIPANVAGSLIINVRLAGAIAYLRGYRLDDPHTQALVPLVAVGSSAQSSLSLIGAEVGVKLTAQALKALPRSVLTKINQKVGFMLLAKYGTQRSVITLAKAIPVAGGLVGGSIDASLTAVVGRSANKLFSPLH